MTIVTAADHAVVREGLRMLLGAEPGFEVVAEAADVAATVQSVLGHKPRVLVLDLSMPGESSLGALPRIREISPHTGVVVLTMQTHPGFAREALHAGALAYLLKEAVADELVGAVRSAADGVTYLPRSSMPG